MGNFIPSELTEFFGVGDETLQCFTHVSLFMAIGTIIRWTLKGFEKNEFNKEVLHANVSRSGMIKVCKFCQIIRNKDFLVYEDEKLAVFRDIRQQAAKHFLVVPKDHLKNLDSVESRHKDLVV
jgi:hypothetical protein